MTSSSFMLHPAQRHRRQKECQIHQLVLDLSELVKASSHLVEEACQQDQCDQVGKCVRDRG